MRIAASILIVRMFSAFHFHRIFFLSFNLILFIECFLVCCVAHHRPTVRAVISASLTAGIADYYKEGATVSVHALNEPLPENGLYSNALSGSDRMELYMTVNAAGDQMMLVSLFDNLGKGSSGAAIQCMNLMLGMNETEGLE